jgi:hypothetical protein
MEGLKSSNVLPFKELLWDKLDEIENYNKIYSNFCMKIEKMIQLRIKAEKEYQKSLLVLVDEFNKDVEVLKS